MLFSYILSHYDKMRDSATLGESVSPVTICYDNRSTAVWEDHACRVTFPYLKYVDLDDPEQREFAMYDPRGFLSGLGNGTILDEIQRVPKLFSYLKVLADEIRQNSLFVLTGSQQFALSDKISQSLAGRTALLCLLPFSMSERNQTDTSQDIDDILLSGFYPRIHSEHTDPRQTLADYFETNVQRDVRQITEIRNLSSYQRFVRFCAGRVGQLTSHTSPDSDTSETKTSEKKRINYNDNP